MKPIQEYTRQEKLEAILEYNPCRTERNALLRYLLAVRREDTEQMAYFESFGNSVHRIILNVRTYERGLLFGYTAKQFDEYGWIRGMLPIVERIELDILNTIFIGQSIDGTMPLRSIGARAEQEAAAIRRSGTSRSATQNRRKARYLRVGAALRLRYGAQLRQHQLQCLEDTQAHGETQRDQTAVFGAEATLIVRHRLKPPRKENLRQPELTEVSSY